MSERLKDVLKENDLVDLFVNKMRMFSVSSSSGTHDSVDPTHLEEWKCEVWLEYGYSTAESEFLEEEGGGEFPESETVTVHMLDCTWGVEFELETSVGIEKGFFGREMRGEGEWHRVTPRFFEIMADLLLNGDAEPAEQDDRENPCAEM